MDNVIITAAQIMTEGGTIAATVQWVPVGGGTQVINVDGKLQDKVHPASTVYHVRFLSPDRMIPDELRSVATFEEACALGEKYSAKLAEHAQRVSDLAGDLRV